AGVASCLMNQPCGAVIAAVHGCLAGASSHPSRDVVRRFNRNRYLTSMYNTSVRILPQIGRKTHSGTALLPVLSPGTVSVPYHSGKAGHDREEGARLMTIPEFVYINEHAVRVTSWRHDRETGGVHFVIIARGDHERDLLLDSFGRQPVMIRTGSE